MKMKKEEIAIAWIIVSILVLIVVIAFPPIILIGIAVYALWTLYKHYTHKHFQTELTLFLVQYPGYFQIKAHLLLDQSTFIFRRIYRYSTTRRRKGEECSTFSIRSFRPSRSPYKYKAQYLQSHHPKCVGRLWKKLNLSFCRVTKF